ncbi:MAG: hypothetical protein AB1489_29685 [Acidobacteriota bacterium]
MLKIRTESLPQRCEVCHQADCFDARNNCCTRCAQLLPRFLLLRRELLINDKSPSPLPKLFGCWLGTMIGLPLIFYISYFSLGIANGFIAMALAILGGLFVGMIFTVLTTALIGELYEYFKQISTKLQRSSW